MADTVEIQDPMNFGTLKALVRQVMDRGGDSAMDDTLSGRYVNAAEAYICARLGAPHFLNHTDTLTVSASTETVTLPVNVADVFDIRDEGNVRALEYCPHSQWSSFIVDATETQGTPLAWTKFAYQRRLNTESPSEPAGALILQFWPVPTSDTTLNYDCSLRPGTMIDDTDHSVLPIQYQHGLVEGALFFGSGFDIGTRAYAQHRDMFQAWVAEMVRAEHRNLGGNERMIPGIEFRRRHRSAAPIAPPTRRSQLSGV